ncbi:MAG: hypothetical protein H8D45_26115 [Bacteroidetes bacterium]|nr:hypothetical protein [Bacteroidota bacterium]
MRNGKCPKCGSATVYSKTEGLKYAVARGVVFVHTGIMTIPSPAIAYICTSCGYFENYIADKNKLSEVAAKWQKV